MVPTGWPSAEWSLGFGSWFNNFFYSGAENYKPKDLATINKIKPKDRTNNTDKIVTAALRRMQGRMLIGGMFASPLLFATSIYYNNYTREKLVNRCYEIRRDADILSYDRTTLAFGAIGWYWKRIQGVEDAEFGSQKLFQFIKKKLEERAGKNQKLEKEE
uniref:Uncharacterized protein n=1 Tax=Meloidogyne javanica TaxID=6303 RepID=A0A915MAJ8_MELJA